MAGVDSNWQGTFVGVFLVLAVYLERSAERNARMSRVNGMQDQQEEAT